MPTFLGITLNARLRALDRDLDVDLEGDPETGPVLLWSFGAANERTDA